MKRLFLLGTTLCLLGGMTSCKSKTAVAPPADTTPSETLTDTVPQYREMEDIRLEGKQTEYVLIHRSQGCLEKILRDIGDDSVELEHFYVAEDDYAYYAWECSCKLATMGLKYYETSADKQVYLPNGDVFTPQDSCSCGVLVATPGSQPTLVDLIDFLFGQVEESE